MRMVYLDERCESTNPDEWVDGHVGLMLRFLTMPPRCTLKKGHDGAHLGPKDETWE